MNYRNAISLIGLIISILLSSCEKTLDFKYHSIEPVPVIEGMLTQTGVAVSLTETTPMDKPMNDRRITDAIVQLEDLTEPGLSYSLKPNSEGIFGADVQGIPGHRYHLTVNHSGKIFTTECLMTAPVEILGIEFNWIKMPYDDVAVLQVSFADSEGPGDRYWLRIYRDGEPYRWCAISDIMASDGVITEVMLTTRKDLEEEDDDDMLVDGNVVIVSLVKVSQEMFEYLEALTKGGSNGPQMFEGPLCLGYFLAGAVSERAVVFHPEEIPYY